MADLVNGFDIVIREGSEPTETMYVLTRRSGKDGTVEVDITGWFFRLCVYRYLLGADLKTRSRHEDFRLDGTNIDGDEATFDLEFLASEHTNLAPGVYLAEIRWNAAGDPDAPPTDAVTGTFTIIAKGTTP